ncbi:MAG: hypothetical protein RLN62_07030 [Rickettsiales bacterium]
MFPAVSNLRDLDGKNGFNINGVNENYFLGTSVSPAGDFNGDGIDDILLLVVMLILNNQCHMGRHT